LRLITDIIYYALGCKLSIRPTQKAVKNIHVNSQIVFLMIYFRHPIQA